MTHNNVICPTPAGRELSQGALNLLAAMARKPLEMTRAEAQGFLRAIFGPAGLGHEPQGMGQKVFCLPGTNDALVLDYVKPISPFEPSPVIARVHWGALCFRPRQRLGARFRAVLRLLGIGGRGDLDNAA